MFSARSFFRSSIHPPVRVSVCSLLASVRSFVCNQTCELDILKKNEPTCDANWHKKSAGQEHETVNFGGQMVIGQGHTRGLAEA